MVNKLVLAAVSAALLASVSTRAGAADIIEPPVVEVPVIEAPAVQTGGWYIRGDIGYSLNAIDDIHYDVWDPVAGAFSTGLLRGDLSESFMFGGGVGYDTGNHVRFDLTADYMSKADFRGNSFCGTPSAACTDDTATLSALSLLANAYVDLGNYHGFKPYVGAGIGGTHVKWGTLTNDCRPGVAGCTDDTHPGASNWRFTYAAMAGVSYDINDCFAIDAGYRYREIAGGKMFGVANIAGQPGAGHDKGMQAHDFRIGARYKLGAGGGLGGCGAKKVVEYEPIDYKPIYK